MQKKLITLAVASVLAAPMMAQAAVEVYGQARVSVGFISDDNPTTTAEDSKNFNVTSHASRLGFRGNDDLGGGMKALWQVENTVDIDDGGWGSARNTFVGLAGGFGTVVVGKHDTPYKIATASLDPFIDTYADYNAVIDATADARVDNAIAYISPDLSGLTIAAAYVSDVGILGGADDNLPDTVKDNEFSAISLAGMYTNGPLFVSLALQTIDNVTGANGSSYDTTKFGVGYTLPTQTKVGLVYEMVDMDDDANVAGDQKVDSSNIHLSVTHPITADTNLKFAYGQADETKSGDKDGGDFLAIGVSKNMTANTELYALYAQMDNDSGAAAANGLVDLSSGFSNKATSALAVGMNLKFSSM